MDDYNSPFDLNPMEGGAWLHHRQRFVDAWRSGDWSDPEAQAAARERNSREYMELMLGQVTLDHPPDAPKYPKPKPRPSYAKYTFPHLVRYRWLTTVAWLASDGMIAINVVLCHGSGWGAVLVLTSVLGLIPLLLAWADRITEGAPREQ